LPGHSFSDCLLLLHETLRGGGGEEDGEEGGGAGGKGAADDLQYGRLEVGGKAGAPKKKRASKENLLKKAVDQRREIKEAGGEETGAGKKAGRSTRPSRHPPHPTPPPAPPIPHSTRTRQTMLATSFNWHLEPTFVELNPTL